MRQSERRGVSDTPSDQQVFLRFYQELNFFITKECKGRCFSAGFSRGQTVKDMIESWGVPHVEVDLILVNGKSVPFTYRLQNGDRISVYPVFERLEIGGVTRVRPVPLRTPRFIADVHLGALARRLRTLGFFVEYRNDFEDQELAERSVQEGLILLTRDRRLLMRKIVTHGLYVRSTQPDLQVREIVSRLDLYDRLRPFSLCAACGGSLESVESGDLGFPEIEPRIPPGVLREHSVFRLCCSCGKVYWKGSHVKKMKSLVRQLEKDWEKGYTAS